MDNTKRFSNRVADYAKYRPGYPAELYEFLIEQLQLSPKSKIAEVGCGTGKFAQPLVERGIHFTGVEPNREMRAASVEILGKYPNFHPVDGIAEETTLAAASMDLIAVAQAIHWFDVQKTRYEFARILKPGGSICVVWNERDESCSNLMQDYKRLITKHAPTYAGHDEDADRVNALFAGQPIQRKEFVHMHPVNFEALMGGLRSASHISLEAAAQAALEKDARAIFDRHQCNGILCYEYKTKLFLGRLE